MNLSICIITKNESEKLEKCLKSIQNLGAQIVVVDTGSTDNTRDIISQYADIAGDFKWCDDFSKARNYAASLATFDNIFMLDSDECVEKFEFGVELLEKLDCGNVVRVERVNEYKSGFEIIKGHEYISRIYNRKYFGYKGRIHEQIVSNEKRDYELIESGISLSHSGYAGSIGDKIKKAERNIKLLMLDLDEYGDDPYTLYQIGKSYYMMGEYASASKYFELGLGFDLDPKLEYVQDMVETYAYSLYNQQRYEEMMFLANIYNEFAVSADYVFLTGLAYMFNEKFDEAVVEFNKATTYKLCKIEGCNSYKAMYNAGVVYECLGNVDKALEYYRKCGQFEEALKGIARLEAN